MSIDYINAKSEISEDLRYSGDWPSELKDQAGVVAVVLVSNSVSL